MPAPSRRRLLTLVAASLPLSIAGCAGSGTQSTQTPYNPSDTEPARSAPSCPDGVDSLDPGWVVTGSGPAGGFELTAGQSTVAQGESLTVTLQNVTDRTRTTGNRRKLDLQYRGTDGWHTIFGTQSDAVWTDIAIEHQPGTAFGWTFTMSEDGITTFLDELDAPLYALCSPIDPGEYRFVYWGITTEREETEDFETDYALGIPFEVT